MLLDRVRIVRFCFRPQLSGLIYLCLLLPSVWGWGLVPGIDGVIYGHVAADKVPSILGELERSDIQWIRERSSWPNSEPFIDRGWEKNGADARSTWLGLRNQGFKVLGFTRQIAGRLEVVAKNGELGVDLKEVYEKSKYLAESHRGYVDAWELLNEPDYVYRSSLVDRDASFQKAMYLGLKAGDPKTPVLRPSIGASPDGYWIDVVRNGLWDYGDGGNFHFYGWIESLDELIVAQRGLNNWAIEGGYSNLNEAPLWLTEINANRGGDERSKKIRWAEQSAYLQRGVELSSQGGVAVIMPFIIRWGKLPRYSMFGEDNQPLPTWNAYVEGMNSLKEKEKKSRRVQEPLFVEADPSPVVMQWVVDEATSVANLFNGSYRFKDDLNNENHRWNPIEGQLEVYNFSEEPVTGRIKWNLRGPIDVELKSGNEVGKDKHGIAETLSDTVEDAKAEKSGKGSKAVAKIEDYPWVERIGWIEDGYDPDLVRFEEMAIERQTPITSFSQYRGSWKHRRKSNEPDRKLFDEAIFEAPGKIGQSSAVTIPAMGKSVFSVKLSPEVMVQGHYFQGTFAGEFIEEKQDKERARSLISVSFEANPRWDLFRIVPLLVSNDVIPFRLKEKRVAPVLVGGRSHGHLIWSREGQVKSSAGTVVPWFENDVFTRIHEHAPKSDLGEDWPRGWEQSTESTVFKIGPVAVTQKGALDIYHRDYPYGYEWTSKVGPWVGLNGAWVKENGTPADVSYFYELKVQIEKLAHEKKLPRVITRIHDGLPADGMIALHSNLKFNDRYNVEIVLVDRWGQAWTIREQMKFSKHLHSYEKFLPLCDFQHTYFSNLNLNHGFSPKDIIELHLVFPRKNMIGEDKELKISVGLLVPN